MVQVEYSPAFADELKAILDWLSDRSPSAAVRLASELQKKLYLIRDEPRRWPSREDLGPGLRAHAAKPYLIIYRYDEPRKVVTFLSVVHERRDLSHLFGP